MPDPLCIALFPVNDARAYRQVMIPGGHPVRVITAGNQYSMGVIGDGDVYTWGWGDGGRTGALEFNSFD